MFLTKPLNIIPFCERQSSQKTTKKLCFVACSLAKQILQYHQSQDNGNVISYNLSYNLRIFTRIFVTFFGH